MIELKELVRISKEKKIKKAELFNSQVVDNEDTLYYQFYKGIADGKYKNDEEAAKAIYNSTPSERKYHLLKFHLKEKLLANIFFLDVVHNHESSYHQAFYLSHRNLFLAWGLFLNNARNNGVAILKKTLPIALKYQVNDVVFCIAKLLRKNYSLSGIRKEYDYYNNLTQTTFKTVEIEHTSEEYFEEMREAFIRSVSPKPELLSTAKKYLTRLQTYCRNNDSFVTHFNMFRVWVFYLQMKEDYKKAIGVCKKAEVYVKSNPPFFQNIRLAEIALMMMESCLATRDYENGKACAMRCAELFPKGNPNWLVFLEYYFLLSMHTGNYEQAKQIFIDVKRHPNFSNFSPERHEKWKIFEVYLHYVISLDRASLTFNPIKFLNEVRIYSKDKRGYNIAIIVIQILFLLKKGKADLIIDKEDALKIYRSHHLNNVPHNFRSKCFLMMLGIMIRCVFDYDKVKRVTQKYLEQLENHPNSYKGSIESMEVIPYENLWRFILAELQTLKIIPPPKTKSRYMLLQEA